jgi:hypothetical protein
MLLLAFVVLSLAVLLGMLLAVLHVRPGGGRARARIGLLHGGGGAAGVALLLLALRGAVLGALAWDAVALLVAGLLGGATCYVLVRRGRPPDLLLVLHGALAFIGYVLLAGYVGTR